MATIICRVVWAKSYNSKAEKFFAGNMSYPKEHDTAIETLNYRAERGKYYGFVESNGKDRINLQRLGGTAEAESINGVTVIWAALHPFERRLKVIGWYENATAFRSQATLTKSSSRGDWHYNFVTDVPDGRLLPESERLLPVPMKAKRTDKGFIGQRNWFFPENNNNYVTFLNEFDFLRRGLRPKTEIDKVLYSEGERTLREISLIARNPKLVGAAKERYGTICQVCKFNFKKRYGDVGNDFIEVHHLEALSARKSKVELTTDDVCVLCANCHRMAHKRIPPYTLDELRQMLRN